ncbi:MAG: hypothetical protein JXA15_10740 [Spirochaetales bacterium]|nr:hypothetical protein [Spirochaetales bacterium]
MRKPVRRAAVSAALVAFLSLTASCWMPSFDPALIVSTEMDDFFAERGLPEWRNSYGMTVHSESDDGRTRFLPFRMPWSDGGYLVTHEDGFLRLATIQMTASGWETGVEWGDGNPLGKAAIVVSLPGSYTELLVYRDRASGLQKVDPFSAYQQIAIEALPPLPERKLLALGFASVSAANDTVEFIEMTWDPFTSSSFTRSGSIGSGTALPLVPTPVSTSVFDSVFFPPGWVAHDATSGTYATVLDAAAPKLYHATDVDPVGTAAAKGTLESMATGTVHDEYSSDLYMLADGGNYTDVYSLDGARIGWLPTGSWRFAFEYWDSGGARWISVFSRFLELTGDRNDDEGRAAFAQVEGVPTADLIELAREKSD